jgi:4'-phosphopantetheinyl transferase
MALASALLKRAYIAMVTGLPWSQIHFSRKGHPIHGKPCWNPPETTTPGFPWPTVDFNVSHQAGLVTLVGVYLPDPVIGTLQQDYISVGCDIVSPNERSDLVTISASDFEEYTSTYSEIFSHEELWDITYNLPSNAVSLLNGERLNADILGRHDRMILMDQTCQISMPDGRTEEIGSEVIIDAKLRRFYTFFCLKEAYIKLVGEGLLAPWIKECEFRNVRAPIQGNQIRSSTDAAWGGKVHGGRIPERISFLQEKDAAAMEEEDLEIWLDGEEVHDVRTEVQAYGESFMIATMIRPATLLGPRGEFTDWQRVNLERDVLEVARRDPKVYL